MAVRSWRPLAAVLSAQGCTLTANRMGLVAIPWLMLSSTGSHTTAGLMTLCQALPYALVQVIAGPLIDRLGPRRISLTGDAVSATAMLIMAATAAPPQWLIMTCLACIGAADGPAVAAKTALLPRVTAAAGQPITRGTALATLIERAATSAGPLICGLIIAEVGTGTLWVMASLFAAGSAISAANHQCLRQPRQVTAAVAHDGTYRQQLRAGTRFLRHDASLRAIVIMYVITNFLDSALLVMLVPVWAQTHGYSAALVGLLSGAFGVCAVLTAGLAAWIGPRLPRRAVYLIAIIISGVSRYIVLAVDASPAVVIAVFAVAGLGSGAACPIIQAVELERIPEHLRGRVQTLIAAWAWAGIPAGGLAAAGLLTLGLPTALWICGIAYLAAVIYPVQRVTWQPTGKQNHRAQSEKRPGEPATFPSPGPSLTTSTPPIVASSADQPDHRLDRPIRPPARPVKPRRHRPGNRPPAAETVIDE
ncbi:MFS transporter [Micromonosporaceae bacterium Da 78-11]